MKGSNAHSEGHLSRSEAARQMSSTELRQLSKQLRESRKYVRAMEERVKLSMAIDVIEHQLTNAIIVEEQR